MLDLGEFCKECKCAKCAEREACGTMIGNTDWYCKNECKGEDGAMDTCSQFSPENPKS